MPSSVLRLRAVGPRAGELAMAVAERKHLRRPGPQDAGETWEFYEPSMSYEELYAAVAAGLEALDTTWPEHLAFIPSPELT